MGIIEKKWLIWMAADGFKVAGGASGGCGKWIVAQAVSGGLGKGNDRTPLWGKERDSL